MIKIKLKKNFAYLIAYFFSWLSGEIVDIIISVFLSIEPSYIYFYLMVLGEIIGGLIIYLYHYNSKLKKKNVKYFGIYLIYNENSPRDSCLKILVLIFFASFFDIYNFYFGNIYLPNKKLSKCVDFRLSSIQTILSALIFTYALKYKMKKHHKASIIALSLCLLLTIIIDLIFKSDNITLKEFFFGYFIEFLKLICYSFNNCIEKYLFDVDYINPFKILLFEGIFGLILSISVSIGKEPFKDVKITFPNYSTGNSILFIFLLFLYFILQMITSSYKVYSNIIFSPMARSLINYILNPLFNIYFFMMKIDFNNSYYSFFLSEIICLIISFFGCIYNEYIIISWCGLNEETDEAIKERAISKENIPLSIKDELSDNDEDAQQNNSFDNDKDNINKNTN